MTEHQEARVDARSTQCQCCDHRMEAGRSPARLCSDCTKAGCDPATELCLQELGD